MPLVVFLRGINVGGHRTFRPSVLAKQLSAYDVVNIGATGTFVVRNPGARSKFRAELLRKLPFKAEVAFCDGHDVIRLKNKNPFETERSHPDIVRFISILSKTVRIRPALPAILPPDRKWFVRVIAIQGRLVFGVYRRHMKTISYLGQIDKLFGVPGTIRNWSTVMKIVQILKSENMKTH